MVVPTCASTLCASVGERDVEVLFNREIVEQVELLKHEPAARLSTRPSCAPDAQVFRLAYT